MSTVACNQREQEGGGRMGEHAKTPLFLMRCDGMSCSREVVDERNMAVSFAHATTQQIYLIWKHRPRNVLVLKKFGPDLVEPTLGMVRFLIAELGLNVWLEPQVYARVRPMEGFEGVQLCETEADRAHVDFLITLGGDGLILHASKLYPGGCPPVLCFTGGSLGFLTTHSHDESFDAGRALIDATDAMSWDEDDMLSLSRDGDGADARAATGASASTASAAPLISASSNPMVPFGAVPITVRMRLMCTVVRDGEDRGRDESFQVLNEVVIDRGSSASLTMLECYIDGALVTKVQADGVLISTPTGSTAYNVSAGGSMVHPNVPCILFTPICPHSLSFRPVVLPDSAVIELKVPSYSRSLASVSFDGASQQVALERGDSVRIHMSQHPMLTVNRSEATSDWFSSLARCLNWNERKEQKPMDRKQDRATASEEW